LVSSDISSSLRRCSHCFAERAQLGQALKQVQRAYVRALRL
jgi:hypothetical protein